MASWMNDELLKPEWRDINTSRDDILYLVCWLHKSFSRNVMQNQSFLEIQTHFFLTLEDWSLNYKYFVINNKIKGMKREKK